MRVSGIAAVGLAMLVTACTTTTLVDGIPVDKPIRTESAAEADPKRRAGIRLQLAASYYQQRQYRFAIEEAQKAIKDDPNLAEAYGMLGLIYLELDDRGSAQSNFDRALRLDGDNSEILNNYGWFLCRTGRQRDSIPYFERAANDRLYSTPARALLNAGTCLMDIRDYEGAEPHLRRSLQLDAANPLTKYSLARLYLALGQLERAGFYYGLLETSSPPSAESLWLGLRIARARGDVRTEQQFASELLRRFPDSRQAFLLKRGLYDE